MAVQQGSNSPVTERCIEAYVDIPPVVDTQLQLELSVSEFTVPHRLKAFDYPSRNVVILGPGGWNDVLAAAQMVQDEIDDLVKAHSESPDAVTVSWVPDKSMVRAGGCGGAVETHKRVYSIAASAEPSSASGSSAIAVRSVTDHSMLGTDGSSVGEQTCPSNAMSAPTGRERAAFSKAMPKSFSKASSIAPRVYTSI